MFKTDDKLKDTKNTHNLKVNTFIALLRILKTPLVKYKVSCILSNNQV